MSVRCCDYILTERGSRFCILGLSVSEKSAILYRFCSILREKNKFLGFDKFYISI